MRECPGAPGLQRSFSGQTEIDDRVPVGGLFSDPGAVQKSGRGCPGAMDIARGEPVKFRQVCFDLTPFGVEFFPLQDRIEDPEPGRRVRPITGDPLP